MFEIERTNLVARPPVSGAQVCAFIRPVLAVGRPVAPPRHGHAGTVVGAPELPLHALVVTVDLVRGQFGSWLTIQ